MQVVFIGGPRHREEQVVLFSGTMSLGEYDRAAWTTDGFDADLAYFVYRGLDSEVARASIGKHLRDEPDPIAP